MSKEEMAKEPRDVEFLLEEAGYALASPEARDLREAVSNGDLDRARKILLRKPQYFSRDEVEIIVQRIARDDAEDRAIYPRLATFMEILYASPGPEATASNLLELLDSHEAPKAIGRLKGERVWRHDEIVPWVRDRLAKKAAQ